jgi:hypothetical protein
VSGPQGDGGTDVHGRAWTRMGDLEPTDSKSLRGQGLGRGDRVVTWNPACPKVSHGTSEGPHVTDRHARRPCSGTSARRPAPAPVPAGPPRRQRPQAFSSSRGASPATSAPKTTRRSDPNPRRPPRQAPRSQTVAKRDPWNRPGQDPRHKPINLNGLRPLYGTRPQESSGFYKKQKSPPGVFGDLIRARLCVFDLSRAVPTV